MLREALQQAAQDLQSLKMPASDDPDLIRLKNELLAAASSQQEVDSEGN